jgi:SsrA-binding protein
VDFNNKINISNKKAFFNYEILDKYIAGIRLQGTEIKSIRLGKASLVDSFCEFDNKELFVKNLNISEYVLGTHYNHAPRRTRKLLLERKELTKLQRSAEQKGLTIIPLRLFISEKGLAKLEIALAKGKKEYDKRDTIKDRDSKRDLARYTKRS